MKKRTKKTIIIAVILFLVTAGIITGIYFIPDEKLSDILLAVFAAISGGALTLTGVAWTIKRQDELRREEERKKAKPNFTFRMVKDPFYTVSEKLVCFDDNSEHFKCHAAAFIENSDGSTFSLERIYHDNKWYDFVCNKIVLPKAQVFLDFNFNNFEPLILEVKDVLGNKYHYELEVLHMGLINIALKYDARGLLYHTLREIRELTAEEYAALKIGDKGEE